MDATEFDALVYGKTPPCMYAAAEFERMRKERLALLRENRVAAVEPKMAPLLTPPNVITLGGYASGLAWIAGAHPGFAVISILADEFDGVSARNLGLSSDVGDRLDFTVDACMLALVGVKIGLGWIALPLTLLAQVVLKEHGVSPPFGSTRAALMGYALLL